MEISGDTMKIYEKILDLLNVRVFDRILEDGDSRLFSSNPDGNSVGDYRVGINDIPWYNEAVWGDDLGKMLKNGSFEYNEGYCDYCEEWVNSFFSDIKVLLFTTPALTEYKNLYNYLRGLRSKKDASGQIFDIYFKQYRDLDRVLPLMFNVGGKVGEEVIMAKPSEDNGPANMLNNFNWLEDEKIPCDKSDGSFFMADVENFFERIRADIDILKVSKLFTDVDVVSRKEIERLEDGVYKVTFENWNIWKSSNKEWLEKMGLIVSDYAFVRTDNLVVQGTYEELATMINLLHGSN